MPEQSKDKMSLITDIGSSSSNGNDDEYRKKLGKKVGERGIDVIRVPVRRETAELEQTLEENEEGAER